MKGMTELKELLKDDRLHLYLGIVETLYLASDRSYLKVKISVLPENRSIISTMTWENVGQDSGDFEFPAVGDMVLAANVEGDDDSSFILKRISSRADTIPLAATTGDKVHRARSGSKYWNVSDTSIFLARGDSAPTENLVLGQVFKTFASDLLATLKNHAQNDADHVHIGNLGYFTTKPYTEALYLQRKSEYDGLKTSPIDDENVLSDVSFTEK